jgi:Ca-activated chloride channel homolog
MPTKPLFRRLPLCAAVVLAAAVPANACFMRSPMPVQVWLDHVHVNITDQVAVKTYDCTFRNANSRAVVGGTCYMELEPGAQVDNMTVLVDGKKMQAEILDVEKAKKVFTDIVKNGGSPALLEYYGNQLIQTQVPRIAPGSTVKVQLTYTMVLKQRGGLVRLQMLNTNPKALMQPLKSASVTVNINSKQPIKNVYSPTHEIKFEEKKGWDISVTWKQNNYLPKHPFVLYYQTDNKDVAASLVAHKELDEAGHFMLMLSPTIGKGAGQITAKQVLPKDVVFCVDTSGSMLDKGKMEQARKALEYCVKTLRPGDRFNIVDFSTTARSFHADGLVTFDDKSKAKALKYVEKLNARGGTAIDEALQLSLKLLGRKASTGGRLKMIVFATDGLPTIGETEPEQILRTMAKKNTEDVRIFVFGEGFDVNTKLLDFLALNHRGEADYILPNENITQKIGKFFDRVGSPIMTDLHISFEGLEVKDVYPRKISDVFKGEQVIIYGRYTGHGKKTIKLTGRVKGATKTFEYPLTFPEYSQDDKASFVPRLWAGRKVDFLLAEIRKQGKSPSKELVNEVTYLAKRYGIVTPYTSFLVTDDVAGKATPGPSGGPVRLPPVALNRGRQAAEVLKSLKESQAQQGNGPRAVTASKTAADLRKAGSRSGGAAAFGNLADGYFAGAKGWPAGRRSSLQALRYIGTKSFYNYGGVWYEGTFATKDAKSLKKITVGSDAYFTLLAKDGRIAKYLALENVVVRVGKTWYHFESAKKPK